MGLFDGFLGRPNPYRRVPEPVRTAGLDLEMRRGFASVYFVNDPERGVAVLDDVCILLAHRMLRLEDFASFAIRTRPQGKANPSETVQAMRDLMAGKGAARAAAVDDPCLVMAHALDPELLRALKVLKLRGLARILAVAGADLPLEALAQACLESQLRIEGGGEVLAFKPVEGLRVVSGLRRTVLSTTRTAPEILEGCPDLAADLSGIREEI